MTKAQKKLLEALIQAGEDCSNMLHNYGCPNFGRTLQDGDKLAMNRFHNRWTEARRNYEQAKTRKV